MSEHQDHRHVHDEDCRQRAVAVEPLLLVAIMPPTLLGGPGQRLVRGSASEVEAPRLLRELADEIERRYRARMS